MSHQCTVCYLSEHFKKPNPGSLISPALVLKTSCLEIGSEDIFVICSIYLLLICVWTSAALFPRCWRELPQRDPTFRNDLRHYFLTPLHACSASVSLISLLIIIPWLPRLWLWSDSLLDSQSGFTSDIQLRIALQPLGHSQPIPGNLSLGPVALRLQLSKVQVIFLKRGGFR